MKKQVLSLAIALPVVLLGAVPSWAGTETGNPGVQNENIKIVPGATLQPIQVKPGQVIRTHQFGSPEDTQRGGPTGSVTPKGPKPPIPPRIPTDSIIQPPALDTNRIQPGI